MTDEIKPRKKYNVKRKVVTLKEKITLYASKQLNIPPMRIYSEIWQNPRAKREGGMRLTEQGYKMLTEDLDIQKYEVEFPKDRSFSNQTWLHLDKFVNCPYYLTEKSIIVFKEKIAVQLVLFEGDVRKFGIAKATTKSKKSSTIQKTN
jgi:hypothetical protein